MLTLTKEQLANHEDHDVKLIKNDSEDQFLIFCFDCESILDYAWVDEVII